jgi:hypothetical protein
VADDAPVADGRVLPVDLQTVRGLILYVLHVLLLRYSRTLLRPRCYLAHGTLVPTPLWIGLTFPGCGNAHHIETACRVARMPEGLHVRWLSGASARRPAARIGGHASLSSS